jgi:phage gp45-like
MIRGMVRGIITSVVEGAIKRFGATGRAGESFSNREIFQHYGFSSSPLSGAEAIILREGNHIIMIASDDRRYRIAMEAGEVSLYTHEGDHVHLKAGRVIELVTNTLLIKAATKVRMETPLVETTGQVQAVGQITDLRDSSGKSMSAMRSTYNSHTHGGIQPGGSNTAVPGQGM